MTFFAKPSLGVPVPSAVYPRGAPVAALSASVADVGAIGRRVLLSLCITLQMVVVIIPAHGAG